MEIGFPNGERGVGGGGLPLGFRHQIELSIRGVEVEQVVVLPCNLQTELWIKLQQPKPNQPITNFSSFLSFPFFSVSLLSLRVPPRPSNLTFLFSVFYLVFNNINIFYLFIFKYHLNFISFSNTRNWNSNSLLLLFHK